jgi:NAD(P)-dependent dehydrogenase (short-subunit alcohol dehydrogenase family)
VQEWATQGECCGQLYPKLCDLCHENDILEMFRWIETCLGGVDVLVNNAGITGQNSLIGKNQLVSQFYLF